jgi:hypothetical protein
MKKSGGNSDHEAAHPKNVTPHAVAVAAILITFFIGSFAFAATGVISPRGLILVLGGFLLVSVVAENVLMHNRRYRQSWWLKEFETRGGKRRDQHDRARNLVDRGRTE